MGNTTSSFEMPVISSRMKRICLIEDAENDFRRLISLQAKQDFENKKLVVEECDVPMPKSGEVLVQVAAAPVNPSDYGVWRAATVDPENPIWLGKEGSGIVVKSGGGFQANSLVGRKVGIANMKNGGSYQEYVCVPAHDVFPLPTDVPVEDACSFFVNPYTAVGILGTMREIGSPGLVHTAAASQLGQMLVRLCRQENVTLINVVRREEQAEILKALGAEHIIITSEDNWKEDLAELVKAHEITCAFDAISGDFTGDVVRAMPNKSTTFVYGDLSQEPLSTIPVGDMIYSEKKVEGWLLQTYLQGAPHGSGVHWMSPIHQASKIVNPGLKPGGWATSKFVDVEPADMWRKFLEMRNLKSTNQKLRIRFAQPYLKSTKSAEHDEAQAADAPPPEKTRPVAAQLLGAEALRGCGVLQKHMCFRQKAQVQQIEAPKDNPQSSD